MCDDETEKNNVKCKKSKMICNATLKIIFDYHLYSPGLAIVLGKGIVLDTMEAKMCNI